MPQCRFQAKIIGLLLAALFTFSFVADIAAQRQGRLIEMIDIQGNRRLKDEDLLKHIKSRPGDRFDQNQIQEDLQSLLKLGLFENSQTRVVNEEGVRGGIYLIFEIMELPIITEVKFHGLKYATEEELLTELRRQKAEITVNSPYEPVKMRKARGIIVEYLAKNRVFFDAKVDFSYEEVSATTIKISFGIDEMPNDDEPEDVSPN